MSEEAVRLSKRMVELGLCSRREADVFIEQGLVRVDGVVVNTLGARVLPAQRVELTGGAAARNDASVSLLLNRPQDAEGDISALIRAETRLPSEHGDIEFLPRHRRQLSAVGAVDPGCSGLVVLTQDKGVLKKLAECEMEFLAQVDVAPSREELQGLFLGMKLDGKTLRGYKVTRQSDRQLRIVVTAPRPLQLQRMCELADLDVESMRCIRIGRIALGKLEPGQWRYLQAFERF